MTASAFLVALVAAVPYKIRTILTDNSIQFRYLPPYADGPTGRRADGEIHDPHVRHALSENGIEHHFTKLNHPWTNGQAERMNRTIKDATVKRYHYHSPEQLRRHLDDCVAAYSFG